MIRAVLQYAIFCEEVEYNPEKQIFSIIKVFDSLNFKGTCRGESPTKPAQHSCILVLGIRGLTKDKHNILLHCRGPNGKLMTASSVIEFITESSDSLHRIFANMIFDITGSGIYYFPVLIDGNPLVEIPLLVNHETHSEP